MKTKTKTQPNKRKQFLAFLFCSMLCIANLSAQGPWDIGQTPGTVTATLSNDTLIVSGQGALNPNYVWQARPWASISSQIRHLVVEEGITVISASAFADSWQINHSNLTTISLPSTLVTIGFNAFYDLPALTTVTFPNGVDSLNIGPNAFQGSALPAITLPEGVRTIGGGVFGETKLTTITIPKKVTSIGEAAFAACSDLRAIEVHPDNPNFSSVDGVLFNKDGSLLVTYPAGKQNEVYEVPANVTVIGSSAFQPAYSISAAAPPTTTIILHDGVDSLGADAFSFYTDLNLVCWRETPPATGGSTAFFRNSRAVLFVPSASIAAYKTDPVWGAASAFPRGIRAAAPVSLAVVPMRAAPISVDPYRLKQYIIVPDNTDTITIEYSILQGEPTVTGDGLKELESGVNVFEVNVEGMGTYTLIVGGRESVFEAIYADMDQLDNNIKTLATDTATIATQYRSKIGELNTEIAELMALLNDCNNAASNAHLVPNEQIQVHPNPVNSELRIVIPNEVRDLNTMVELFDMNGKRVYSAQLNSQFSNFNSQYTIDMSSYQSGNYLLRIGNGVAKIVKK